MSVPGGEAELVFDLANAVLGARGLEDVRHTADPDRRDGPSA